MTEHEYSEKRMSVFMACYVYATEYHTGQWSRAYRLGCIVGQKGFRPGSLGLSETDLRETDPMATDFLDRLIARGY